MKKLVLFLAFTALIATQATAQRRSRSSDVANYSTALGVRVNPYLIGFTIKHFLSGPHAIEGIVHTNLTNNKNVTFTGLYEYHWNAFGHPEWNLYAGGGVHIGVYDRFDYDRKRWDRKGNGTYATVGMDGIIGVEYTFKKIPLNLSADLKPFFHFSGETNFIGEEIGGISARYTF
ncbi:hypothetical protein KTO58_04375 [Chitinophaga pendula]|uniref:hypothetical protein n=1 Tax=Chitinophaga TaxID=79328 RepID=UPI000BB00870|nr:MULTISPECIES: hypothetical protein [Chitinophaga]ASZ13946.1 hypothetical protein CK934_24825 [Chitinophaga sp. MD30]UCJ08434.1 hypothetical protein KTO58_04375 [Chitinophaga pendula]